MTDLFPQISEIESRLGLKFKNKELLELSFIHRSFWHENQTSVAESNERLEFLGDSVLGLIIADYLHCHSQKMSEGTLSELRSQLVDATACAYFVQKLDVTTYLLLGKGEQKEISSKAQLSIFADLFEAVIGAIYLDQGFLKTKAFFLNHFQAEVEEIIKRPITNWKKELQDYAQKIYQKAPIYKVIEESGLPHQKTFFIAVWIGDMKVGEGEGTSKKEAEIAAAKAAFSKIQGGQGDNE